ncbi:mRNA capping enzyme [Fomitiporia mediterranea MF3/22]|uniref:mRNA capping enzyme n=1 Tax=Fomitiporia mediterranea (strain MF3/22) TaxID=694068 RepID=UPI000440772F|nr:mRNA capping enzyme [Fomitiporia mediterranea MF3/22]EJC98104.1 mRNA capping enzyme [Fomitiporia mediterranea MF3/22]
MGTNLKPLSLSILGVEPLDEFIREIADFIYECIRTRPDVDGQVEVEAKLGLLKYRDDNVRVAFPVRSEAIISSDDHRFESNMTALQHKHFNQRLNQLEASSHRPDYPSSPIRYQHSYLIDSFYPSEGSDKIRVTRDEKTGDVKECMKKIRLGNLDIFSPKNNADWRVSVNMEIPVPHPVGSVSFSRRKDRMSYSHEEFVIDLTQVTQTSGPGGQPQIMHELEVELARPSVLLSTAAVRGAENAPPLERDAYDELIRAFVNNVRVLVRNTRPPV